jgi:hypothetical protein
MSHLLSMAADACPDLPQPHRVLPSGEDGTLQRCAWVSARAGYYGVEQAKQFELYHRQSGTGVNKAAKEIGQYLVKHEIILGIRHIKRLMMLGRYYLDRW